LPVGRSSEAMWPRRIAARMDVKLPRRDHRTVHRGEPRAQRKMFSRLRSRFLRRRSEAQLAERRRGTGRRRPAGTSSGGGRGARGAARTEPRANRPNHLLRNSPQTSPAEQPPATRRIEDGERRKGKGEDRMPSRARPRSHLFSSGIEGDSGLRRAARNEQEVHSQVPAPSVVVPSCGSIPPLRRKVARSRNGCL
jgi:hypothetical protein